MFVHVENEALEQRQQVMRPGTGFRVPLKAEDRTVDQLNALQREVEQRAMGRLDAFGQGLLVDGKAVILARDHDLSRL